jgi:4-alpha-glucanotransferase
MSTGGDPFAGRTSGVILHPTSLPGPFGVGDLGPAALHFADFLAAAGQTWWQMLPLAPPGAGNSPYDSPSAFAASALFVSLERLVEQRLLDRAEIEPPRALARAKSARYEAARRFREPRLRLASARFKSRATPAERLRYRAFCNRERRWLEDWALFAALKRAHRGAAWTDWEPALRNRHPKALVRARRALAIDLELERFVQYEVQSCLGALRARTKQLGIRLLGDAPIYVAHDSADVWTHRELFFLDRACKPSVVAGVPPDYFSRTGQLWGNPLYRWGVLKATGFEWWLDRLEHVLEGFDALRLDHFIGFRRYYAVAAGARTAQHGRFVNVPGEDFFAALERRLGDLPFVAEDLGLVTPGVEALRERVGLPGMRVLQFAFGDEPNLHLPHRYPQRSVAYTGTHDNDTLRGFLESPLPHTRDGDAMRRARARALAYAGSDGRAPHWDLLRMTLASPANTALFQLQDPLGLGSKARFNVPGTIQGNWTWRLSGRELDPKLTARLAEMTVRYERTTR